MVFSAVFRKIDSLRLDNSGYTLYLISIVVFVTGLLLISMLSAQSNAHISGVNDLKRLQAELLAESGIERAEYFLNGGDGHTVFWETEEFTEEIPDYGRYVLSVRNFGFFKRIESLGERLDKSKTIRGYAGRNIPEILEPSITRTSRRKGLVLYGKTKLEGSIVMTSGILKKGESRRPVRNRKNQVIIKDSPALPFSFETVESILQEHLREYKNALQSGGVSMSLLDSKAGKNLESSKTLVISGNCRITDAELEGKDIYISGRAVIENGAGLKETRILADKIEINGGRSLKSLMLSKNSISIKGGRHSSQFISCDTVSIQKEARVLGNSLIMCFRKPDKDSVLTGGVVIESGSRIKASVISVSGIAPDDPHIETGISVNTGEGSSIQGVIVTDETVKLKGCDLQGRLWCSNIISKHEKTTYLNGLWDCTVSDPETFPVYPVLSSNKLSVRIF